MDIAGLLSGPFVRVVLYLLIFWPTVGYYVYQDTKRRENPSPRLKGIVYGFFGIAGVLFYEVRKERSDREPSGRKRDKADRTGSGYLPQNETLQIFIVVSVAFAIGIPLTVFTTSYLSGSAATLLEVITDRGYWLVYLFGVTLVTGSFWLMNPTRNDEQRDLN